MGTIRQNNKELYWAWKSMKQRCLNPRCKAYKNYGKRGISICDEWMMFEPFFKWAITNGYKKGLDLDRQDNNGNYEPNNCRWIERVDNINNRRVTILLSVDGITKPRTQWEKELKLPKGILKSWVTIHNKKYAEMRLKDILINGYKPCNYSFGHRKKVIHTDTGMIFNSVKDAAEHFKISPHTISNAIRANRSTEKGKFTFEIIEEI